MTFTTVIRAVDPRDGELKLWAGPLIHASSWHLAEMKLQTEGLGYCKIDGVFESEQHIYFNHELN